MANKRRGVKQIFATMREVEKLDGREMSLPMAAKMVDFTDQTLDRWRIR